MPLKFEIDTAKKTIICKVTGALTAQGISDFRAALQRDPAFETDLSLLFDMLGVTEFQISSAKLQQLAERTPMNQKSKRAYVTPTETAFGLIRVFSAFSNANAENFQVFRDLGEARKWLGLD